MASTLSPDQQELTFFSFPIEKREETAEINPVDGTPDILIWGKATDGTIDGDNEIVDPEWSAKALQEWAAKGNVRMSHDPRRPVGRGQEVQVTTDGHWVKSLIADPLAKHFIRIGALNDYSVGISNPDFRYGDRALDPQGKALRVITGRPDGSSRIAELSIVDRGSNFNSAFEVVRKSAADGAGFTGKMVGPDEEITAARAVIEKGAGVDTAKSVNVNLPPDVSVSFSPADLAKLLDHRKAAEARELAAKAAAGVDTAKGELSAADRARLPASAFAFVDDQGEGHLPVHDEGHVRSALGRFGGQQFPDHRARRKAARKIVSRAHQLGIDVDAASDVAQAAGKLATTDASKAADGAAPCGLCRGKGKIRGGKLTCPRCHGDAKIAPGESDEHGDAPDAGKEAEADVEKAGARDCPDCGKGHDADSPSKFCSDCGSKLPSASAKDAEPDLAKDDGSNDNDGADGDGEDGPGDASNSDDDSDDEDDRDKAAESDADKAAAAAPMPAAKPKVPCPGCGKGVKPKMAFCPKCGGSMKASAEKSGKPTPDGGAVAEHLDPVPAHREPDGPYIESLEHDAKLPTDPDGPYLAGSAKAAAARIDALGVEYPLGALHDHLCPAYAPGAAAKSHPEYGLADVDLQYWAEKAVSAACDAPFDEAAAMEAQSLWQHAATIKALSPATAAEVSAEAHKAFADANPGPGTFPTPAELTPQRFRRPYITAGHAAPSPQQDGPNTALIPESGGISATDYQRGYLDAGRAADSPSNKDAHMPPGASNGSRVFYRNTGRDDARSAMQAVHDHIARTFPDLCPMGGDRDHGSQPNPLPMPAGSAKAADAEPGKPAEKPRKAEKAARAPAADAAATANEGLMTREEALAWLASDPSAAAVIGKAAGTAAIASPDLVKAAVADAVSPLLAELAATRAQLDAQADTLEAQGKALRKSHKMLDAIAGQPDQNGPYRGAPLQQFLAEKAMAPTALSPAQAAEQSQRMVYEELHRTWRESPDATARLAAEDAMAKMRGIPSGGLIAH